MRTTMILAALLMTALCGMMGKPVLAGEKQTADEAFFKLADEINLTEVKLGKIAMAQAGNEAVKKFGDRIAKDHAQLNKELRGLADKKGIALPTKLDKKHQELVDSLSKLKGREFDMAFTKDMVAGHAKAIDAFEVEVKNGKDAVLKAWAEKSLPTLREHLKLARETVKDVRAKEQRSESVEALNRRRFPACRRRSDC